MAYKKEEIETIFENICLLIEQGKPVRQILSDKDMPSSRIFYKWFEEKDENGNLTEDAINKVKRYARATEIRAENIFEEILEISDNKTEDHTPFTGANVVNRARLQIDARKWILAKMNPKKYGDKLDLTNDGDKFDNTIEVIVKK